MQELRCGAELSAWDDERHQVVARKGQVFLKIPERCRLRSALAFPISQGIGGRKSLNVTFQRLEAVYERGRENPLQTS
jgi:hypothetical protein